jgi:hypothetical protein
VGGICWGGIRWGGICNRCVGHDWGVVGDWCVISKGSVVRNRGGDLSDDWGGDLGNDRGGNLDGGGGGLLVDDGVESVDGVGGVIDGTTAAVGLNKGVRSADDVSVAAFVLLLLIASHGVGHRV